MSGVSLDYCAYLWRRRVQRRPDYSFRMPIDDVRYVLLQRREAEAADVISDVEFR